MNFSRAFRIILAAGILVTCADLHAAPTNTTTLAIFLFDAPKNLPLNGGTFDARSARLIGEPLLTDRDFLSYNTNTHTFSVSADTARRMAKQLDPNIAPHVIASGVKVYELNPGEWRGQPFAVLAGGETIYVGAFHSQYSSFSSYRVPLISLPVTVPLESKEPVTFEISAGP